MPKKKKEERKSSCQITERMNADSEDDNLIAS